MSRKISHPGNLQEKRSIFIGRAYALVATIGTVLFLWVHTFTKGFLPDGLSIYFILAVALITTYLLSLKQSLNTDLKVHLLQSNYYSFVVGILLIADLNYWNIFYILSALVTVMLTFQTIRTVRGLFVWHFLLWGLPLRSFGLGLHRWPLMHSLSLCF